MNQLATSSHRPPQRAISFEHAPRAYPASPDTIRLPTPYASACRCKRHRHHRHRSLNIYLRLLPASEPAPESAEAIDAAENGTRSCRLYPAPAPRAMAMRHHADAGITTTRKTEITSLPTLSSSASLAVTAWPCCPSGPSSATRSAAPARRAAAPARASPRTPGKFSHLLERFTG